MAILQQINGLTLSRFPISTLIPEGFILLTISCAREGESPGSQDTSAEILLLGDISIDFALLQRSASFFMDSVSHASIILCLVSRVLTFKI